MSGQCREIKRFCTLERDRGETQIRWSLDVYEPDDDGDPAEFVSARRWYRGNDGQFHPTKAGITIRLGELDEVVAGLQRVQQARTNHESDDAVENDTADGAPESEPLGSRRPTHTTRAVVTCEELDAQEVF